MLLAAVLQGGLQGPAMQMDTSAVCLYTHAVDGAAPKWVLLLAANLRVFAATGFTAGNTPSPYGLEP